MENGDLTSKIPELSVVIVIVSDAKHLEGCLTSLLQQVSAPETEIIVPYDCRDSDILLLEPQFPKVQFHPVENLFGPIRKYHEHLDKMRAIGIDLAQGKFVALLEDHDRPDKNWAMNVIKAHKDSHAGIGGAVENEVDRLLNWSIYFCDFGRYQKPFKAGQSNYITDVNASYKWSALENIRDIWQDGFHEPFVNSALIAQGETLWLSPEIVVYQHRENLSLVAAIRERYVWGRYYAGNRTKEITLSKRLLYLSLFPILPLLLMAKKTRDMLIKKRLIGAFLLAFPLTTLLTLSWSFGEFMGYLSAKPSSFRDSMNDKNTFIQKEKNEYDS